MRFVKAVRWVDGHVLGPVERSMWSAVFWGVFLCGLTMAVWFELGHEFATLGEVQDALQEATLLQRLLMFPPYLVAGLASVLFVVRGFVSACWQVYEWIVSKAVTA